MISIAWQYHTTLHILQYVLMLLPQYIIVFLIVTIVVWLGDGAIRYIYSKLRQLHSPSQTPAVQYHREHGEESISLLDETATAAASVIDNDDNDDNVTLANELIENDQIY